MGDEVRSGWVVWSVLSRTEVNVIPDREGAGSEPCRRGCRFIARVNANLDTVRGRTTKFGIFT